MQNRECRLGWYKLVRILGDIFLINFAITLAFLIRFNGDIPDKNFAPYLTLLPIISILTLMLFHFFGLYHTENKLWSEISASLFVSLVLLSTFSTSLSFMIGYFSFPRSVFLLAFILRLMFLGIWRWIVLNWERKIIPVKSVIIIATNPEVNEIISKLTGRRDRILGVITDSNIHINCEVCFQALGTFEKINETLAMYQPDVLIVASNVPDEIKSLIIKKSLSASWEVYLIPTLYEIMLYQCRVDQLKDTMAFKIGPTVNPGREHIKRLLDFIIASVAFVITLPIMLMVALVIKLDSDGPVLFSQERVTKRGKRFLLYKFRTMVQNAESKTGPVLSHKNDTRITKVGKFLRATRLDELPQLINIIKGEMSIVGPRPERPFFVEQFEQQFPEYSYRHLTNPGLTGLAQIAGQYSTSVQDKLRYDLMYLKSSSPLYDLQIMLQTVKVLFIKDKAS